jgi:hypothetical protein
MVLHAILSEPSRLSLRKSPCAEPLPRPLMFIETQHGDICNTWNIGTPPCKLKFITCLRTDNAASVRMRDVLLIQKDKKAV